MFENYILQSVDIHEKNVLLSRKSVYLFYIEWKSKSENLSLWWFILGVTQYTTIKFFCPEPYFGRSANFVVNYGRNGKIEQWASNISLFVLDSETILTELTWQVLQVSEF